MPYQGLLDRLVHSGRGVNGALLLDATGEAIVESGARGDAQRLIGAYLGLALVEAREAVRTHQAGRILSLVGRFEGGAVIVRPLKDNYFLVVSLEPSARLASVVADSAVTQERLNAEL